MDRRAVREHAGFTVVHATGGCRHSNPEEEIGEVIVRGGTGIQGPGLTDSNWTISGARRTHLRSGLPFRADRNGLMTGSGKGKRQGRPSARPVTEGGSSTPGGRPRPGCAAVRQALPADMDASPRAGPAGGGDDRRRTRRRGRRARNRRAGTAGRAGQGPRRLQLAPGPGGRRPPGPPAHRVPVPPRSCWWPSTRDHGMQGTVAAFCPPPNIAQAHLEAVGPDAGPDVQELLLLSCAAGLSRVRALAVAGPARGGLPRRLGAPAAVPHRSSSPAGTPSLYGRDAAHTGP